MEVGCVARVHGFRRVRSAPRHFQLGPRRPPHPLGSRVEADDAVLGAAVSCPMEAILVADADTDEPIEAF